MFVSSLKRDSRFFQKGLQKKRKKKKKKKKKEKRKKKKGFAMPRFSEKKGFSYLPVTFGRFEMKAENFTKPFSNCKVRH
jgi:hypothetical protein